MSAFYVYTEHERCLYNCFTIIVSIVDSAAVKVAESARDLGVILDAELTMSAHVTAPIRILSTETVTYSRRSLMHYGSCQDWFRHSYLAVKTTAPRFCMK